MPAGRGYRSAAGAPNLSFVDAPNLGRFRRTWWEIWGARRLARKWSADWVLALGNVPLLGGAKRKAVLLHDPHLFYPMDQLSHLSRKVMIRKRFARAFLALSIRRQAVSFVQTSVAAKRVTKMYRIKSDDVVVIPNALSSAIRINIGAKNSEPLGLPDAGFRFLTLTKYAGRKGCARRSAACRHNRDRENRDGEGSVPYGSGDRDHGWAESVCRWPRRLQDRGGARRPLEGVLAPSPFLGPNTSIDDAWLFEVDIRKRTWIVAASDGLFDFLGRSWARQMEGFAADATPSDLAHSAVEGAFAGGAGDNVAVAVTRAPGV